MEKHWKNRKTLEKQKNIRKNRKNRKIGSSHGKNKAYHITTSSSKRLDDGVGSFWNCMKHITNMYMS